MDKILLNQNPHWRKGRYDGLYDRILLRNFVKKLPLKEILVFVGVRRSGKSTLCKLCINYLIEKRINPKTILYLNIEDPFFMDAWKDSKTLYSIIDTAEKITGEKVAYLFLDEIQNVDHWEAFVKSVYDSDLFKKIIITGSNNRLLEGAYAQFLSGRYTTMHVYPFSFKELLHNRGIDCTPIAMLDAKNQILRTVDTALFYGMFPEVTKHNDKELKRALLISYYDTILLKDCITNHRIRDEKTFAELAHYLISNNGSLYSYRSLADIVGSNENSMKQYLHVLEKGLLLYEIKKFSYSLKKHLKSKNKVYCIDNGFLANISFRFSEDKGKLFENLVFTEFLKQDIHEIYFYHTISECDFIVKQGTHLTAYQVTYMLSPENSKREITGLKKAMAEYGIKKGYIITYDQEEKIDHSITVLPFWKFATRSGL